MLVDLQHCPGLLEEYLYWQRDQMALHLANDDCMQDEEILSRLNVPPDLVNKNWVVKQLPGLMSTVQDITRARS